MAFNCLKNKETGVYVQQPNARVRPRLHRRLPDRPGEQPQRVAHVRVSRQHAQLPQRRLLDAIRRLLHRLLQLGPRPATQTSHTPNHSPSPLSSHNLLIFSSWPICLTFLFCCCCFVFVIFVVK